MPFAYYQKLSRAQKAIYRRSDAIQRLPLEDADSLHATVVEIAAALKQGRQARTQAACQRLVTGITRSLAIPRVTMRVLAARPSNDQEELYGYYTPLENGRAASITVWMRTAQRRQLVAFRTFLRTVLHELCHHIDYEWLQLEDSFHTQGFYQRESSLFQQLIGAVADAI